MKKRGGKLVAAAAATALAASSVVALGGVANAATTITVWGVSAQGASKSPWEALTDAFKKKYPQYNVEYKNVGATGTYQSALATALQAGNAPDIFKVSGGAGEVDGTHRLAKAGFLLDIGSTAARNFATANERNNFTFRGKTYSLPVDKSMGNVVANLTLMKEDGLTWPTTFADLLKQCKVAADKGRSFFGFAGSAQPNQNLINAAFGQRGFADTVAKVNGKKEFRDSSGWRTQFDAIAAVEKAGCFQKGWQAGGFPDAIDGRRNGKLSYAFFVPGGVSVDWTNKNYVPGATWATAFIPATTAAETRVPVASDYAWAANAKTKNAAAVKVFLNFAASEAGQKAYTDISGSLPYKGSKTIPTQYSLIYPFVKSGKTYTIPYTLFSNPAVTAQMAKGTVGILTGQTTVSKVLRAMDSAW
jgi:raffinose/stachyose/melibiose transport system substrate-binding protein